VIAPPGLARLLGAACPWLSEENFVLEPVARDTAAALGLAAVHLQREDADAVMAVFPADHVVRDDERFQETVQAAVGVAVRSDCLVTIGIRPSRPETGYGYIQTGEVIDERDGRAAYEVLRFTEKPDRKRAERFAREGFLWNAGMFVWRAGVLLEAIATHMPELHAALSDIGSAIGSAEEASLAEKAFAPLAKISIDFGVMEKAKNVLCVPGDFFWDDVGCWTSLRRVQGTDAEGNVAAGECLLQGSRNCIAFNDQPGLVAVLGADDLIVVRTQDAVLVASAAREQELKSLIQRMEKMDRYRRYL
jgi:mannose-1-phosphate guanylyltransferase